MRSRKIKLLYQKLCSKTEIFRILGLVTIQILYCPRAQIFIIQSWKWVLEISNWNLIQASKLISIWYRKITTKGKPFLNFRFNFILKFIFFYPDQINHLLTLKIWKGLNQKEVYIITRIIQDFIQESHLLTTTNSISKSKT